MKTLIANLKNAARTGETAHIGGGRFSPKECHDYAVLLEAYEQAVESLGNINVTQGNILKSLTDASKKLG